MTYRGHIKNGVPVLDSPVKLPEGAPLQVQVKPDGADFWHGKSVSELAEEQGVRPIKNLDDLASGWPENEFVDDFLALIRRSRGTTDSHVVDTDCN